MKYLFSVIRLATYLTLLANQVLAFTEGPLVVLLALGAIFFLSYDAYQMIKTFRHNRDLENK